MTLQILGDPKEKRILSNAVYAPKRPTTIPAYLFCNRKERVHFYILDHEGLHAVYHHNCLDHFYTKMTISD